MRTAGRDERLPIVLAGLTGDYYSELLVEAAFPAGKPPGEESSSPAAHGSGEPAGAGAVPAEGAAARTTGSDSGPTTSDEGVDIASDGEPGAPDDERVGVPFGDPPGL